MKKKALIIRSSKQSLWGSCKVISPNLQACYSKLSSLELHYFDIADDFLKKELTEGTETLQALADKITTLKPDGLIFIDHEPTAPKILSFLSFYMPVQKLPPLTFHIYGDFTFFANEWKHLGTKIKDHPVKLIVASEAQKKLMSFFCHDDQSLEQFLFPVNKSDYFFDSDERKLTRDLQGVNPDERIILYSGRVSLQKNVDLIIQEFPELYKAHQGKLRLWIAGAFDDMGAPFMGVKHHDGFMFAKLQALIESLPGEISKNITLFGQVNKTKLRQLKNAADCFISLSLYHDEDFGMSPAEALSCGLPSLLTDWGGYSSFVGDGWNCKLLPVQLSPYGHELEMKTLHSFVGDIFTNDQFAKRKEYAENFQKKFSIESSAPQLEEILLKPFKKFAGFKWNLGYFSTEYWTVDIGREISKQLTPSSDNFYAEVYSNYISGKTKV